jgi:hypothetical protein
MKRSWSGSKCGCCEGGILVAINGNEIQKCDECNMYRDDVTAAIAVLKAWREACRKRYARKAGGGL